VDDPGLLVNQLDLGWIHLKEKYLLVNLCLQLHCFFVLDLAMLEHLVNVAVLVHQQVVLCPSVLDCLANLRERVLNVRMHVLFGAQHVFLGLKQNFVHEVFVLDHLLNHLGGLVMAIYEVNNYVVTEREVVEKVRPENLADQGKLGKSAQHFQKGV
jgi:hypothetical protein